MKMKDVKNAAFTGDKEFKAFYCFFQAQVLRSLMKRGLLSSYQYEKGLSILKEKSR